MAKYTKSGAGSATRRTWEKRFFTVDPDGVAQEVINKTKYKTTDTARKVGKDAQEAAADLKAGLGADIIEKYGVKATAAVIALVGVASVADHMMKNDDKKRSKKQQRIQKKQHDRKQEKSIEDRNIGMIEQPFQRGLVQEMFDGRIGHSNTWGGRKY